VALATLWRELERLRVQVAQQKALERPPPGGHKRPGDFAGDPVGYAREILGIHTLTPEQEEILPLVHVPPYKVLVPSAHDVGKTYLQALLTNYWYDCFDPSVVLTTAPTARDVRDLLWTEIRLQRLRAGLPMPNSGPVMPYMGDSPEHYCKGFTARKGEMFKGRHRRRMLYLFDEGNEIEAPYFTTTKTMFDPADGHAWVVCYNPTTTTSAAYQESLACEGSTPRWHRRRLSALTHPNVLAELRGQSRPIPGAVSLEMINGLVHEWCEEIRRPEDRLATDFEWPPSAVTGKPGRWYRPGANFQSRVLGIEPDTGDGVWSPALWEACLGPPPPFPLDRLPHIGCDCALGRGEDFHAIHARWGAVSVHHETSNVMDPLRIFGRIKEVCRMMAEKANGLRPQGQTPVRPEDIRVSLDDDGVGGAVGSFLRGAGYAASQVGAGTDAQDKERYPNARSELWFRAAGKAKKGLICLSLLDRETLARLRQQLLAPKWKLDEAGRMKVEKKDETKATLGRSPDDADSLNLSHYELPTGGAEVHSGGGRGDWRPGNLAQPEPPRQVVYGPAEGPRQDYRQKQGGHFGYR
jgi:hypothetical protein